MINGLRQKIQMMRPKSKSSIRTNLTDSQAFFQNAKQLRNSSCQPSPSQKRHPSRIRSNINAYNSKPITSGRESSRMQRVHTEEDNSLSRKSVLTSAAVKSQRYLTKG